MAKADRYVAISTDAFLHAVDAHLKDQTTGPKEVGERRCPELVDGGTLKKKSPARKTAKKR